MPGPDERARGTPAWIVHRNTPVFALAGWSADVLVGDDGGVTAAPTASPKPPARTLGNWRSLVLSMSLVFIVVVGWLALAPRPNRIERPAVDAAAKARPVTSENRVPVAVLMPPADWRATSVSWNASPEGLPTWIVGYHRRPDDTEYVTLAQTVFGADATANAAWVTRQVRDGSATGGTEVAGTSWEAFVAGGDPVRRSLVVRRPAGQGLTTVLTGNLSTEQLAALARTLTVGPSATSNKPSTASSTPSASVSAS